MLLLGTEQAARWAERIAALPKSLAAKLGISAQEPALVFGRVDDEVLAEALHGATTSEPKRAALLVAVMGSMADLDAAITLHAKLPCRMVWAVHPKGPKALPSDAQVRTAMYAQGWRDSKTSAVSATLTATRYGKPAA